MLSEYNISPGGIWLVHVDICRFQISLRAFDLGAYFFFLTLSVHGDKKLVSLVDSETGVPFPALGGSWVIPKHPNREHHHLRVISWSSRPKVVTHLNNLYLNTVV